MRSLAARALAISAVNLLAWSAGAATFTVNGTADTTDGACTSAAAGCTLREAIERAVATPGRDTIRFAASVFPPGAPAVIVLTSVLPTLADAAGTVLDGAGAGVILEPGAGPGPPSDPLIFASGAGAPLRRPTIANVTVRGFVGSAITICGGELPGCDEDVSGAVVQNVVATGNGGNGITILGRNITKTRVTASVVSANAGRGFACEASEGLTGTRIDRLAASANGGIGIRLFSNGDGSGNSIANSIAAGNLLQGIYFTGDAHLTKTKLTNLSASSNAMDGIVFGAAEGASGTIAAATATDNGGVGLWIFGAEEAVTVAGVVVSGNGRGILVAAGPTVLGGVSITNVKAVGNVNEGIVLQSSNTLVGNRIAQALLVGNGDDGLKIVSPVASGNVISGVHASANGGTGILLDAAGTGNTLEDNRLSANQVYGIAIYSGSTLNVVRRNTALLSASPDLDDENAACVNTWEENVFETSFGPCIH